MSLLDHLAEARIQEAVDRGEFDDLPGAGKPLILDDEALVPEERRTAYRLLKNAGYVPPEVLLRREIADVEQLINVATTQEDRASLHRRLQALLMRLSLARGGQLNLRTEREYFDKLSERLARGRAL